MVQLSIMSRINCLINKCWSSTSEILNCPAQQTSPSFWPLFHPHLLHVPDCISKFTTLYILTTLNFKSLKDGLWRWRTSDSVSVPEHGCIQGQVPDQTTHMFLWPASCHAGWADAWQESGVGVRQTCQNVS